MRVDFHSPGDLPAEVVRFWAKTRLQQDRLACFTTGPEWFMMMAGGNDPPATVCVGRNEAGKPEVVLPLLFREGGLSAPLFGGRFGTGELRTVRVFGGDLVWDDDSRHDPAQFSQGILDRYPEIAAIRFDHVVSRTRTDRILESCSRNDATFAAWEARGMPHYRLELPPTFAECCAVRSGKSMKQIRRHAKRLGELHEDGLRMEELRDPVELTARAAEIEKLMAEAWQAAALGHRLDVGQVAQVAARGWVRSFFLRCGPIPVAFVLCYQAGGTLIREQSGYNPEYAKYYPGEILLYMMLERLYRDDTPKVVDFGVGEGYHKRAFANDKMMIDAIWIVRDTPANRTRFARFRCANILDRTVRVILDRIGVKRLLVRRAKKQIDNAPHID